MSRDQAVIVALFANEDLEKNERGKNHIVSHKNFPLSLLFILMLIGIITYSVH